MTKFRSGKKAGGIAYGGNLNIWIKDSKTMTEAELEAAAEAEPGQFPDAVRVLIVAVGETTEGTTIDLSEASVLVDETLERGEFSSGAIGFKHALRSERFV